MALPQPPFPWLNYKSPAVGKYVELINPAHLNPGQKQQLWKGIKKIDPALADLLANDTTIAALKTAFDATVGFTKEDIERYLAAGKPG